MLAVVSYMLGREAKKIARTCTMYGCTIWAVYHYIPRTQMTTLEVDPKGPRVFVQALGTSQQPRVDGECDRGGSEGGNPTGQWEIPKKVEV